MKTKTKTKTKRTRRAPIVCAIELQALRIDGEPMYCARGEVVLDGKRYGATESTRRYPMSAIASVLQALAHTINS